MEYQITLSMTVGNTFTVQLTIVMLEWFLWQRTWLLLMVDGIDQLPLMFRHVKLGVELSCPDVVHRQENPSVSSQRVFRQMDVSVLWVCALLSWVNSTLSVKLCVLYSRFIARFLKAVLTLHYVIVTYLQKIVLVHIVGLTFVLRVFLCVFTVFFIFHAPLLICIFFRKTVLLIMIPENQTPNNQPVQRQAGHSYRAS